MKYFTNIFSPATYEAFKQSPREVSGFKEVQLSAAKKVQPGDRLVCYLTKLGRWWGVLEVLEGPYVDGTPIFQPENDPYVVRFNVRPLVLLEPEKAVPIREPELWDVLSYTKGHRVGSTTWTGRLRSSLTELTREDAILIERLVNDQLSPSSRTFEFDQDEYDRHVKGRTVRRADRDVAVSVPDNTSDDDGDDEDTPSNAVETFARESHRMRALIADIGARMGMTVWVPRSDRSAVAKERRSATERPLAERLPLNYDDVTLSTIENIDVIWLRGRSIVRAFEVEHTTSVYSGILRMADLLALQPNMDIKTHIVAPPSKREKVFQEIRRPVFSLLERRPLADICTYISYDSLRELANEKLLEHMGDSVLDEYAEVAEV